MFRLGSFGGLILTDAAGEVVMPQRRRLALLALLAAAGERGLSRDKVLGYLWSESSSENARHALEQLLYSMRKQVAEPLFQGTDPLRLDTRVVHADVVEFARAMAANDPSSAVAVYRGPFLDGFYLAGAPEFERWVEAERTRLEAEHGEALRKLAAEAHSLGRRRRRSICGAGLPPATRWASARPSTWSGRWWKRGTGLARCGRRASTKPGFERSCPARR